jgi:hypothetical protein
MSELATCKCPTAPHTLMAGDRTGTLAGGAPVEQSYCFVCHTWLHIVDGVPVATPMIPQQDALPAPVNGWLPMPTPTSEAVRATRFMQVLDSNERTDPEFEALVELGFLVEDKDNRREDAVRFYDNAPDLEVILAALQQSGRGHKVALWLAAACADWIGEPGKRETQADWLAAAYTAAGHEAEGLLDALDTHFEGVLQGMYHFQISLATPEGNPFTGSATRILGRAIVAEQKTAPAPAPEGE